MDVEYLQQRSIQDPLKKGLVEALLYQPQDPVKFLGKYLLDYKQHEDSLHEENKVAREYQYRLDEVYQTRENARKEVLEKERLERERQENEKKAKELESIKQKTVDLVPEVEQAARVVAEAAPVVESEQPVAPTEEPPSEQPAV